MINKKCSKCGKKVSRKFSYCPFCGSKIKSGYGYLGVDDNVNEEFFNQVNMSQGFGNLFNSLFREIEREFQKIDKERGGGKKGISINISSREGRKPRVDIRKFGKKPKRKSKKRKIGRISKEKKDKIKGLPRKEAETEVRRLSDRIIYEIKLPGVKSFKDVIINRLENSIEVKAVADDKVYFKLLPVSLPIKKYGLNKGKLFLELKNN
jgi:hypothetical protein